MAERREFWKVWYQKQDAHFQSEAEQSQKRELEIRRVFWREISVLVSSSLPLAILKLNILNCKMAVHNTYVEELMLELNNESRSSWN